MCLSKIKRVLQRMLNRIRGETNEGTLLTPRNLPIPTSTCFEYAEALEKLGKRRQQAQPQSQPIPDREKTPLEKAKERMWGI